MTIQREIEDIYELSPLQQGMLFHSLLEPETPLYFEQFVVALHGPLEIKALGRAWQLVADQTPVLRTSFHWEDLEKPLQVVHRGVGAPLVTHDWRHVPPADEQQRMEAYLLKDRQQGFRLDEAPLMRLALIRMSNDRNLFVWSFHHLLLDGWSAYLVNGDVSRCYEMLVRSGHWTPPQRRAYVDYINWLQAQDLQAAEAFWRRRLRDFNAPTPLPLAIDNSRDLRSNGHQRFGEKEFKLSNSTTAGLRALTRRHKITASTLAHGAWALVLSRYSGERRVLFGTVVSGRPASLAGVESMVGLFINALPTVVTVPSQRTVLAWLEDLQISLAEARLYEYSPLMQVQDWCAIPRGTPLFESILIYENHPGTVAQNSRSGERSSGQEFAFERTNLPITILIGQDDTLWLKVIFDRQLFSDGAVDRILEQYCTVLETIIDNPSQRVDEVALLTKTERRQIAYGWNETEEVFPEGQSLAEMLEEVAAGHPARAAYIEGDTRLTFRELNQKANELAHYLRLLGVGPEVLVAVCLPRSLEQVVAFWAILKSGGAYLPLDPGYPRERLAFMLVDAGASILISRTPYAQQLANADVQLVDLEVARQAIEACSHENLPPEADTDNLAYVIYTSGSTGKPKGVAVPYRQIHNRLEWMWKHYPLDPDEVGCQKTALNFVDSLWELLGPALKGLPTVIIPDAVLRDPDALVESLARHKVSRIWVVPSFVRTLLELYPDLQKRLPDLRVWVCSGEPLAMALLERFREVLPQSFLYNLYGTSEVWDATWYVPDPDEKTVERVPIGYPISNVRAYILDSRLQVVPPGVIGELCVGGDGLARGYVKRQALTAERFVPDPYSNKPGARLYRSGDLARYLPNGNIEFIGRKDHQVKIRGYRVELGEIEEALLQHVGVSAAVVLAISDPLEALRLVAHVVCRDSERVTSRSLRDFLETKVPAHMIPALFVFLDQLPLTPNGKINRRALPVPDKGMRPQETSYVAPQTALEELLTGYYAEQLGLEQVGVNDNFFELGGHSLAAMQLVSRIRSSLQIALALRRLFEAPTVSTLAGTILDDADDPDSVMKVAELTLTVLTLSDEEVEAMLSEGSG